LNGNPDFGNLPRKFKITVNRLPSTWCTYPEINDSASRPFGAETRPAITSGSAAASRLDPMYAAKLDAFIEPDQALDVVQALTGIFRDSDELRINRAKGADEFLFLNHGWTADRFLAEIKHRTGLDFPGAVPEVAPRSSHRDHVGLHPKKGGDRYYAGFSVLAGRIGPDRLTAIANLAEDFWPGAAPHDRDAEHRGDGHSGGATRPVSGRGRPDRRSVRRKPVRAGAPWLAPAASFASSR